MTLTNKKTRVVQALVLYFIQKFVSTGIAETNTNIVNW